MCSGKLVAERVRSTSSEVETWSFATSRAGNTDHDPWRRWIGMRRDGEGWCKDSVHSSKHKSPQVTVPRPTDRGCVRVGVDAGLGGYRISAYFAGSGRRGVPELSCGLLPGSS